MAYYGVNFRTTAAFVTDGTNEVYEDGSYPYPWTHGVLTHGRGSVVPSYRDRVNTNDRRIAGMNYNAAGSPFQETIDLPDGAGDYDIWLAAGDASSVMQCHVILKDGATTLATITGTPSASNNFIDANGVNRSAATWPTYAYGGASAATGARRITMTGTALTVIVATGGSGNIAIAHIGFQKVVSGAQTLTPSLFTNSNTFYSPTVSPGAVALTPSLLSNTNAFYSATVSLAGGSQSLTPALFSNANTFYASTVVRTPGFLTPVMKNNTRTVLANETGVTCIVSNPSTGALVLLKTGLTSDANGVVSVTDNAMVEGTTYAYDIILASGARSWPMAVA